MKENAPLQHEAKRLGRIRCQDSYETLRSKLPIEHRVKVIRETLILDDASANDVQVLKDVIKTEESSVRDAREAVKSFDDNDDEERVMIEGFIVSISRLTIRTINDLSSELSSVNDELNRERDRNESCASEIDRLRAMLRVSSGDGSEYRKRIDELNNFVQRMDDETWSLKRIEENENFDDGRAINERRINSLKSLMNELRMKLKNDQDALFAGGNKWCSMYVRKVRELNIFAENLLLQLEAAGSNLKFQTETVKFSNVSEYKRGITETEQLVKRVARELANLTLMPMKIGPRVGYESCAKYSERIGSLEKLVNSSMMIIGKLIIDSNGNDEIEALIAKKNDSQCRKNIEALATLAKKIIFGIKQLETVVAGGDGAYSLEKIRQLEGCLKRLKIKLVKSEEEKSSLTLELTGAKIAYGEKSEELERIQKKYEKIVTKMKKHGGSMDGDEQMEGIVRQLEQTKLDGDKLRDELNQLKPEVTKLRLDRTKLADELESVRGIVAMKNEEIAKITKDKKIKERALTKETNETRTKLANTEKKVLSLKEEILEIKEIKEIKENEATAELKSLRSLLKTAGENLNDKNRKCADLESNLSETKVEKSKIEDELSCAKKQNETLVVYLNLEKTTHSKTLKDFEKLISDFRSLNNAFDDSETDRKKLEKKLENSEGEKRQLRVEIDDCRRKITSIEKESSCLRSKLEELRRELVEANEKNCEMDEELKKSNVVERDKDTRLNSLARENEKLSDELDRLRSDKLNIAGMLNEANYNCESMRNQLETKISEMTNMEEKMTNKLGDLEALEASENLAKSEVEKLLEEQRRLNETIDIANLDKARLENRLKEVEDDYRALENKLRVLNGEKDAIASDSSALNRRVDELNKEVTIYRDTAEKNARERSGLLEEHENTITSMKEKLEEFENERTSLENELSLIKIENTALKRDYQAIVSENEKVQPRGKKSEGHQLIRENEALRLQISKMRIFISEVDRNVAKNEIEKMCSELVEIRAENSSLKKFRNRRSSAEKSLKDCRKHEEELNTWKSENQVLRKNLETARNRMAANDARSKDIETERNMLKGSIEGLKERYKTSKREIDDIRLRNEKLNNEINELKNHAEAAKRENCTRVQELKDLRENWEDLNDEHSKIKVKSVEMEKELVALKDELARSRAENVSLNSQLTARNIDFHGLLTENARLASEVEETRCARMSAIEETSQLRSEQEKLVTLRVTLESKLIDAQNEISKYIVATGKLNDLENKLKNVLRSYVVTKKLLKSANEEIDHLHRFAKASV